MLISQLKKNLRKLLTQIDENITIGGLWDFVEVNLNEEYLSQLPEKKVEQLSIAILERLSHTPGIDFILKVKSHSFTSLDEVAQIAIDTYSETIKNKTFCVRVKRSGKHAFNSTQVEQKVGGALLQNSKASGVSLNNM